MFLAEDLDLIREIIDMAEINYENCEYYPPLRHGYSDFIATRCLFDCYELTQCLNYRTKKKDDELKSRKYIREEVMKQMD